MTIPIAFPFTSVTRWLLVVVGCAVLATAQPMSAADEESPRKEDTVIYPKNRAQEAGGGTEGARPSPGGGWMPIAALLLACAGGWVLWQKRRGLSPLAAANARLSVEETKNLGNRQYLVVARYEGQKFLLGVTPGQIQLISKLDPTKPDPTP